MKIIVCGAGQVGTSIAKQLASEGNDVTVIDQDQESIQRIGDTLDVKAYWGFASHPTVLEAVGASGADMVIAVTLSDEVNMIACQVAHSLFDVPTKIARIRHENYLNPAWKHLYRHDHLPIDVIISPEMEVAKAIIHRLHVPGAVDTIPFANGVIKVIGVRCRLDCPMVNMSLKKIQKKFQDLCVSILGVVRDKKFIITAEDVDLLENDEIYFVCAHRDIPRAMELFGHEEKEARRIVIVGGGNVGLYLAQMLEQDRNDLRVKLIELDSMRAEFVAERVNHTTVINGDALEKEILEEANIMATETVIAVTNEDEVNILSSLLAKRFGCQRTVTLINNATSYSQLVSSLGVDVVVNPRETTVSSILQHVRRGRVLSVYSICEGAVEIMEAEAVEASPMVGKSIADLGLPYGIAIGSIMRDEEVIIPKNDTVIVGGDRIIILCKASMVKKVEKIFSVRFEFF